MEIIINNKEEIYARAKKRMEELKGFYWHVFVGILVIPMVIIINWLTTDFPWAIFPVAGYLLSIIIHWFAVFQRGSFFSREWETKKIKEFIKEEEHQQNQLYN